MPSRLQLRPPASTPRLRLLQPAASAPPALPKWHSLADGRRGVARRETRPELFKIIYRKPLRACPAMLARSLHCYRPDMRGLSKSRGTPRCQAGRSGSPSRTAEHPGRRNGRRRGRSVETVRNRYRKQQEESGRGKEDGL